MTVFSFFFKHSLTDLLLSNTLDPFFCDVCYIFLLLLFNMFFFPPLHALSVHASNVHIELFSDCLFLCLPRVADKTTRLDSTLLHQEEIRLRISARSRWCSLDSPIFVILPVLMESLSSSCVLSPVCTSAPS